MLREFSFRHVFIAASIVTTTLVSQVSPAQRPIEPYPLGLNTASDMEMLRGLWRIKGSRETLLQVVVRDHRDLSTWSAKIYHYDSKAGRWKVSISRALAWLDGKLDIAFVDETGTPCVLRVAAFREAVTNGFRYSFRATLLAKTDGKLFKVISETDLFHY